MDIYIGNLPSSFSLVELQEHLLKALRRSQNPLLFWRKHQPELTIKHYEKKCVGQPIHYFVLSLSSEKLAQRLIRRLNSSVFNGMPLTARELFFRSCMNERRAPNQEHVAGDQRQTDRRSQIKDHNHAITQLGQGDESSQPGIEVHEIGGSLSR